MTTTEGHSSSPSRETVQGFQEQLRQQLPILRQAQEMQDWAKIYRPGYQVKELVGEFEQQRQALEVLKHVSVTPSYVRDIIEGQSNLRHAKQLMEQYMPKNSLAGFGVYNDTVRQAAEMATRLGAMHRSLGLDSVGNLHKQYEQLLKPSFLHQEMLANLQRQAIGGVAVSDFARHMAMTSPAFQAMETARKSLDRLLPALRNIDLSDFAKLESDELTTMHASDAIAQSVTPQDSLQESVDKIISAIQAQKEPTVQLILWLIFRKVMDWLIAGAIGAVMGYYAPTLLDKSPQAAKKTLEETVRTAIGASELLSEFRYVSNDLLIVRQNPRARSPEIGRLTFGKAVRLLKREKDFAFVVWTDIDRGAEIQGWVFSRYLGKFN